MLESLKMMKTRKIEDITKRRTTLPERRARAILRSIPEYNDRYEVRQLIAEGRGNKRHVPKRGFLPPLLPQLGNNVFSLYDRKEKRFVCAKMHLERGNKKEIIQFRKEYSRRKSLGETPYLIPIYDFVVLDGDSGNPSLFMELGADDLDRIMDELMEDGSELSLGEILRIGTSICYGVESVHETKANRSGLANLDLKPGHVIFMEDGSIKLCDCLESAMIAGMHLPELMCTPYYAAPETICSGYIMHPTADVYSFGIVLSEMATLKQLFDDERDSPWTMDQLGRVKNKDLARVIEGCVQPEAADRYQTMAEVRHDLEGI